MKQRGRPVKPLELTDEERRELMERLRLRKAPADEKLRIGIVLCCADGVAGPEIAKRMRSGQNLCDE